MFTVDRWFGNQLSGDVMWKSIGFCIYIYIQIVMINFTKQEWPDLISGSHKTSFLTYYLDCEFKKNKNKHRS